MTIRPADDDTLADCLAFDHLAPRRPDRRTEMHAAAAEGRMLVAVEDEHAVGYLIEGAYFFGLPFLELLYIADDHRRDGIGAQLVAAFEQRHQDAATMFTSTNLSNAAMQALLRGRGWSPRGMLHWTDDDDPEVFFAKVPGQAERGSATSTATG